MTRVLHGICGGLLLATGLCTVCDRPTVYVQQCKQCKRHVSPGAAGKLTRAQRVRAGMYGRQAGAHKRAGMAGYREGRRVQATCGIRASGSDPVALNAIRVQLEREGYGRGTGRANKIDSKLGLAPKGT